MEMKEFFPTLIAAESLVASFVYAILGQWGSALYWLSACTLNVSVIFLIRRFG